MSTKEMIIAKAVRTFKARKTERDGYGGTHIRIEVKAYRFRGNAHPHFSVQTDIATNDRFSDHSTVACGCIHDVAARYWPKIKPIIDLHLSNADDGEPMHAVVNGWYWFAGAYGGMGERYHGGNSTPTREPAYCLGVLAEHLRLGVQSTQSECLYMISKGEEAARACGYKTAQGSIHKNAVIGHETRKLFRKWIDRQRPRWESEAIKGLVLIKALSCTGGAV